MNLVVDGIYDYDIYVNVRLVMCDIDKNVVKLKDKHGNYEIVTLDEFRAHGEFKSSPTSYNKDYASAQKIWCDYKESNMDVKYPFFDDYCRMRLSSQK